MFGAIVVQCSLVILLGSQLHVAAMHLKAWPPMKSYDIWNSERENEIDSLRPSDKKPEVTFSGGYNFGSVGSRAVHTNRSSKFRRKGKIGSHSGIALRVLNFFPVAVDEECFSNDGRRSGVCLNVYECRMKGGTSHSECAMGFGVCCVFVAECEQEIKNNVTYIVSPNFPNFMTANMTSCRVKVRLISEDISQLRIDFNHFMLAQPNRRTGVCDGDVFSVTGGPEGPFILCGQNSGQHMYYEVGGGTNQMQARQTEMQNGVSNLQSLANGQQTNLNGSLGAMISDLSSSGANGSGALPASAVSDSIEILMNFTRSSFVSLRLWEIRVAQIPFSQRAPAGCLQYYTGLQGAIQTFNFAENGRHLANQNYRACIRQESNMCSIAYEPCDEQSFRIGPSDSGGGGGGGSAFNGMSTPTGYPPTALMDSFMNPAPTNSFSSDMIQAESAMQPVTSNTLSPSTQAIQAAQAMQANQATQTTSPATLAATTVSTTTVAQADDPDVVEGSGGGDDTSGGIASPPIRGGFNIFQFFRNVFRFGRSRHGRNAGRQFSLSCNDRITIPCIVEDFIGGSLGPLPGCEPIHCGSSFCSSAGGACRIESTVTPFRVGIHFGDGIGKGNAEDNIGMCLKYNQQQCI